jgi:hypothetical protein
MSQTTSPHGGYGIYSSLSNIDMYICILFRHTCDRETQGPGSGLSHTRLDGLSIPTFPRGRGYSSMAHPSQRASRETNERTPPSISKAEIAGGGVLRV